MDKIDIQIGNNFQSSLNQHDAHVQAWKGQLDAMHPLALVDRLRHAEHESFDNAWDYWQAVDKLTPTNQNEQAPEPHTSTPEPEAIHGIDAKKSLPKWLVVTGPYIANVLSEGKCSTAKELFGLLESKTVIEGSPFKRGTGAGRGCLYVTEINKDVCLKTFQNAWTEIKKHPKMELANSSSSRSSE